MKKKYNKMNQRMKSIKSLGIINSLRLRKPGKKAISTMGAVGAAILVLVLVAVLLLINGNSFMKAFGISGAVSEKDAVELCAKAHANDDTSSPDYDYDNDNIPDICDTCVFKMSEDEFGKSFTKDKGSKLAERGFFVSNTQDTNANGVPDVCDSEPKKFGKKYWFSGPLESECKQVAAMSEGILGARIFGEDFKRCQLYPVDGQTEADKNKKS